MAIPESYEAFEEGSVVMDFLMSISGIMIIAPSAGFNGVVYGMKK